jgi:RND family efflux transporter MFP subunit
LQPPPQTLPKTFIVRFLLSGHTAGEPENAEEVYPWYFVPWITGVVYFPTLEYQPGIALLPAGALSVPATAVFVLVTLLGAVPVYAQVARRSYAGQGSIALLEKEFGRIIRTNNVRANRPETAGDNMSNVQKRYLLVGGVLGLILLALILGAVRPSKQAMGAQPSTLDVEVVQIEKEDVPIYADWIGTLDGLVNADVRAQVTGYLLKQGYQEGSLVRQGQLLFQIDPRPFQAALDQAQGQLAQAKAALANAEAVQHRTELDVQRYKPLAEQQAASQQDLDNAVQNNLAAIATVETAKAQIKTYEAAVETAKINLDFTRLVSPIDGVAGQAQLQVGALVSPNSGVVTSVSTVDPIKVYFTVSEPQYLSWRRRFPTEESRLQADRELRLQLILADGSTYPREGKFYFADRQVNETTGAIRIAGLFPNPNNILRPGGYAKVRAVIRTQPGALLVPQRAVSELQGGYQIAVVGADNRVDVRTVTVGDRVDNRWIIANGLSPGDRIVVEGVQRMRNGVRVNPKPFVVQNQGSANR